MSCSRTTNATAERHLCVLVVAPFLHPAFGVLSVAKR